MNHPRTLLVLVLALLAALAAVAPAQDHFGPDLSPAARERGRIEHAISKAAHDMVDQARALLFARDYDRAEALAERAMRSEISLLPM